MKNLKASEIRQNFIDYFVEKGHMVEPSAPLVPIDDDSLLWINSGVATLKKYFDGRETPRKPRIVNSQKAIRTNDIENVGFTARHHTFFEMLGNFSIGDYFKQEAIEFAWEFLTSEKWMAMEPKLLYVTIHPEDKEAYRIWNEDIGLEESRIIRIEGNFWDIGEGPSGPNTEIFYDRGEDFGQDDPAEEMYPGGENERFLEVWNLVFSEFNHNKDHTYTPLPNKNIDTGMGLERMASLAQNVRTNYETDLFMPIIHEVEKVSGKTYLENDNYDVAFKVIADHIRTIAFAIADGALPANEGRGYVLRRLLRRAVRFSQSLDINEPFMYRLVDIVADIMEPYYPNVKEKADFIKRVIKSEEERFHETLEEGLAILNNLVAQAKTSTHEISGKDAFKLYDTYGFPVELTEEIATQENLSIDMQTFEEEMQQQRDRARQARQNSQSMQVQSEVLKKITTDSTFVGYDVMDKASVITDIIQNGELVESAEAGETIYFILRETPFYAVSGGQVADQGTISNENFEIAVTEVTKAPNGQNLHKGEIQFGTVKKNAEVSASVNHKERRSIKKNHSATHLLHAALKEVLGDHVNQAGSLVEADRLRFDFSHFGPMTQEEIDTVERRVNEEIWNSIEVDIQEMPISEAKQLGAMALFGEKYGEIVRVVNMAPFSIELCGGIHVNNTAEIGLFKIVSESGTGAGVRRIEALTGKSAFLYLETIQSQFNAVKSQVKVKSDDQVLEKIVHMQDEEKELTKQLEQKNKEVTSLKMGDITNQVEEINGLKVLATEVDVPNAKAIRETMDDFKSKLQDTVIVLISNIDGKVSLVATVPKALTDKVKAGDIIKNMAPVVGGKGGGRPDMAQGGGTEPKNITESLRFIKDYIKSL
ncbi:alanine--tRNA ligase [Staphylococcus saprophyticus]|jgi:alanyl-tRNA synthetase|uniref:Alanine--tRNA ligase n=2 Tax=Staphylococcus TaxID=1279 RepID=SYA_STAS1|nr:MULTISPECIES: alanine--tRNA ligase [Staphylococcus]Q49Y56.1 RecName: Full=Alanine--tRNA ligase; AltName: Full=Alanyl-tRNA synthetase; Short=AlaRS [Staphylococcus saprophyticus subsp. saprophyticus ATCC 15305 = NCTC 7292]CRV17015.1 alanyl-tRNA synthetase [Streptococcus equi subsp. equi]AMG20252.1 alanine--tRNA ligase [Staphylococcus saprophyticus]AMG33312.1 alanine--tRNA ligase [Staphylococcus saprophyticus]ASF17998.1 alanine--tRNA ligase [Staphylococcus saprophyticus]MBC2920704.1 alanine--